MKLPKKVSVLSYEYKVVYCNLLSDVSNNEMDLCWGVTSHKDGEIRVFRHPSDVATLQTLAHEIVHCYEQAFGLRLEEKTIDFIATLTVDHLVRNKWIIQ